MSIKVVLSSNSRTYARTFLGNRRFVSFISKKDGSDTEEKSIYEIADESPIFKSVDEKREDTIEKKRNKSRLNPAHRNMLLGCKPYEQSMNWHHDTVRYKKRMLGRYGLEAVEVPAGFAWPIPEEVDKAREYEKVAYPRDIKEEWLLIEEKRKNEAEYIKAREAEIDAKMACMAKWTIELQKKLAAKEAAIRAAKEKKERLIEEVRRHFGYKISVNDEKFKEMLIKKENEERKKQKEVKKKKREEYMITRAMETAMQSQISTTNSNKEKTAASESQTQQKKEKEQ